MPIYGGIEAGGTKFVCGVGNWENGSLEKGVIPTRDPAATFRDVAAFFRSAERFGPLAGMGIASFGPLDLDPASSTFGRILDTPKPHWSGVDLLERTRAIADIPADIPLGLDTDVNAAALAEATAAGEGVTHLAYVTVGTGIGVGVVSGGVTVRGLGHPEGGHILPRRHPAHAGFAGICPFHGDCLEGLASGPAIEAAWGQSPSALPDEHVGWEVESDYLAQLCVLLLLTMVPMRIVLGGGVMEQARLFPLIHRRTAELLGGYKAGARTEAELARVIVPPRCAEPSGLLGAYLLAERSAGSAHDAEGVPCRFA